MVKERLGLDCSQSEEMLIGSISGVYLESYWGVSVAFVLCVSIELHTYLALRRWRVSCRLFTAGSKLHILHNRFLLLIRIRRRWRKLDLKDLLARIIVYKKAGGRWCDREQRKGGERRHQRKTVKGGR